MVLILSHEGENTNMDILHHFSLCLGFVLLDFTDKIFNEVVIVGTPLPDDTWRASLSGATPSGLPQEEAHDTCKHHIRTIAYPYPSMLSESLTKVSKSSYVILTTCHSPCSAALRWCVQTPCPDIFCSLHSGFAYGKGLQSFSSSCF